MLKRDAGLQVDQGVVLLGVHYMKGGVTRGLLTKDVRSPDGWQIGIDVFDHVQVGLLCSDSVTGRMGSIGSFDFSSSWAIHYIIRVSCLLILTAVCQRGILTSKLACKLLPEKINYCRGN